MAERWAVRCQKQQMQAVQRHMQSGCLLMLLRCHVPGSRSRHGGGCMPCCKLTLAVREALGALRCCSPRSQLAEVPIEVRIDVDNAQRISRGVVCPLGRQRFQQ